MNPTEKASSLVRKALGQVSENAADFDAAEWAEACAEVSKSLALRLHKAGKVGFDINRKLAKAHQLLSEVTLAMDNQGGAQQAAAKAPYPVTNRVGPSAPGGTYNNFRNKPRVA